LRVFVHKKRFFVTPFTNNNVIFQIEKEVFYEEETFDKSIIDWLGCRFLGLWQWFRGTLE
jgi:hypothetical protein